MATAGSIVIDLLARTGSFITDMDRASKKVGQFGNDIQQISARLDKAALTVAGFAAAGVAALTAMAVRTASAAEEIRNYSNVAGANVVEFQRMAAAAEKYGISQEKLADQLKDFNEKVGEFARSGGGGMKDFFEQVAPKVGVTAEQFRKLSGPQGLQAYYNALEKAGLNQQEMSFYLESMASDTTALIPILRNGGEELNKLADRAQRFGFILSESSVEQAAQLNDALRDMQRVSEGASRQLGIAMVPALQRGTQYAMAYAGAMLDASDSMSVLDRFSESAVEFIDDIGRASAGIVELGRVVGDIFSEIDDVASDWLKPFGDQAKAATNLLQQSFTESVLNTAREIDKLVGLAGGVAAVWAAVGHNIPAYFELAWGKVLNAAADFVNNLADLVNPMLETLGMEGFSGVAWGKDVAVGIHSLSDAFARGRDEATASVNAFGRVQAAIARISQSASEAAGALGGGSGGGRGGGGGGGGGVAGKLTEAQKAAEAFRKEQERALVAQYQSISSIHAQAQGLEDQVALFGLSKSALEDLTIARLEEEAVVLRMYGDRSKDAVEAIEAEISARKRLRLAMGSLEQKEAERASWQEWAQDVKTVFDQVGQSLTDAIFDGGKSGLDLLKDWAKTLTLRVLVQPVMGGLQAMLTGVGPAGVATGGSAAGGLMGSPTSLFSMFGGNSMGMGISNVLTNLSSSSMLAGTGIGNWMTGVAGNVAGMSNLALGGAGLLGGLGANLVFGGKGYSGIGGGLGSTVGMALGGPIGAVAGTLLGGGLGSLFGDREPTTRREQRTQVEYAGGVFDITKTDDRAPAGADAAARALAEQAVQTANDIFKQVGVDAAIDSFHAIMASSYKGDRDGVASGGTLRIGDQLRQFGIADEGNPTIRGFGGWSSAETLPRLATDIQLSVLEAFQAVSDQLPSVLSTMLEDVDIRSLGEQEAQALAERFASIAQGASAFLSAVEQMPFDYLRDVTFDAAANMVQFAGGLDNLLAAHQTYYERFYSDAERQEFAASQLSEALAEAGLEMPALVGSTEDMLASYRALVEAQDRNTEEGQRAYVMLIQNAGAFADLAAFAGQAQDAVVDLGGSVVDLSRTLQEASRAAAQSMASAWSSLGTASGWAAQYLGDASGLQAQLAMMQRSYASGKSVAAREAALGKIIALEQAIWDVEQRNRQAEAQAAQRQVQALQQQLTSVNALLSAAQRLRGYAEGLQFGADSGLSDTERLDVAAVRYRDLLDKARGGDTEAMSQLQSATSDYLRLAQQLSGSQAEYSVVSGRIAAELAAVATVQEASAKSQADLLNAQIETAQMVSAAMAQQFELSEETKELIAKQLVDSASQFDKQMARLQRQIEQGDVSIALLDGLPTELTGVMHAVLVPPIASIADAAMSAASMSAASAEAARQAAASAAAAAAAAASAAAAARNSKSGTKSYDVGTSFVPYDMNANVHRGEIIIDPRSSDILRRYGIAVQGGGSESPALQMKVERLEVQMSRVAVATEKLADQFDHLTMGGNEMLVRDVKTLEEEPA